MKTAQQLASEFNGDINVVIAAAESKAIAADQNWDIGLTRFVFDDNSQLAVRDASVFGFDADDASSIRAYSEWVGTDATEQAECQRLLEELE